MQKLAEKTEIKVSVLVAFAGVSKSTWHEWKTRKGIETRHNHETPKLNWYTPEERQAVVKYVLTHKNFLYGYRYLAWQMIDENVAFVRPASVYNIMKEYDLVHRWAKNEGEAKKKGFDQPEAPHEQWHTDISYVKVLGVFYYFISIMDGYSRKILDWVLCENMEGINIELLVARVKEKYPEARARIIHDNGKQFISKDFKSLISLLELYETAARVCHPQSNGKLERFHSTLKTEHVRQTAYFSYEDAKEKMAQWIDFYNNKRLHGALLYLTPADYFEGRKESRLAERREKLHTADINRKAYWLQQQQA